MSHTRLKTFSFVASIAALAIAAASPIYFTQASEAKGRGLFERTTSHEEGLPNYDIRSDRSATGKLAELRSSLGREAADVADIRERFVEGEAEFRSKVPTLKVEYQPDLMVPELIAPDVKQGRGYLTQASSSPRVQILKEFLKDAEALTGVQRENVEELIVEADYENPEGGLSFVELSQKVNGVPVFRGEVKAGFSENGRIVRVINNLAPALEASSISTEFGDAVDAVRAAAKDIDRDAEGDIAAGRSERSTELKEVFGKGDWATTAEKFYFPTEPGVAVPAWRVLIWNPVNAYYVVVSAQDGTRLWRKNITEDQSQASTYDVYANPNAMINVADSAGPLTPGPIDPAWGTQGAAIGRSNIVRIGNEGLYSFNNNGWITDGQNITDGNNVESGLDLVAPDGIDPGTQAVGEPTRVFSSAWNPPPGNPAPGEAPTTAAARRGAVIQQFYIMNWYHDELYRLGFTESARNFQHDNFGRGGLGGDRISAQGQDYAGTNNANFSSPADGARGRMQMYIWTGPDPDRDGTGDADIVIHEVTHGTSNRLHGNSSGLVNDMARAMGEGWSDFYAHALLSEPSDPLDGVYALSGYSLYQAFGVVGTRNYYYGIRRFPKAIMSSTGGPNNRPHNPTTFADIDQTKANFSDGAFAAMSGPHVSLTADQVHAAGEIWSAALWEVRAKMIARLGWEAGNRRMLQFTTDGMKLSPLSPTFLNSRDAILAAAQATGTAADVKDIWEGFAIRGMGASASIQNVGGNSVGGTGTTRVTEAFDMPNLRQEPTLTIDDSTGNANGVAEPGEPVKVIIPLSNTTGSSADNVIAQIVGGGSASYGSIAHGQTVSRAIDLTIPAATPCGAILELSINVSSTLGPVVFKHKLTIGTPQVTFEESFDGVAAPGFPAGWVAEAISGGINFVTTTTSPDTAPNSAFALNPLTVGGGTNLTSPPVAINTVAATLTFRNRYATELGWDGGVLEISIGDGPFQDILAAGGSFLQNGYNGTLGANGVNNPIAGRAAWTGNSAGYLTTSVLLPATAQGQNARLRWRFGADDNTAVTGWNVDTIKIAGNYTCSYQPGTPKVRADFDGDGKSDPSVFRPSEGNWYTAYSSTGGLGALLWGYGTDTLVPGDYDDDGKTDHAIWRPSTGQWWIVYSNNWSLDSFVFGEAGDIPVAGDYDGDGMTDAAIFRPSTNTWHIRLSSGGFQSMHWGEAGDKPVPGDYDGDGKTDYAIWRPTTGDWWIAYSSGGLGRILWGYSTDKPVPADYDGDGRDDIAIYRPSEGMWYIIRSSDAGLQTIYWGGEANDLPVPGDYDGDGKYDAAIYRSGMWYFYFSSGGLHVFNWGVAGDRPVPGAYIP